MQQTTKDNDDNVVTLMTAHASKGLEFPCVFVCGCADGVMPLNPRGEDGESVIDPKVVRAHYEEERRVFYVAITRAEEMLTITYPSVRRSKYGEIRCIRSCFCREAGNALGFTSLVQEGARLHTGTRRKNRRFEYNVSVRPIATRAPDGGVSDIMAAKDRLRHGIATEADLAALKAEEERIKAVFGE
jgi:hypothetical protein